MATISGYEPGPGTSDSAGSPGPSSLKRCSSSALSGHVQPAGKSPADLVVSWAWPPSQWEGWGPLSAGIGKLSGSGLSKGMGNTIMC